jgi:signal peptidase
MKNERKTGSLFIRVSVAVLFIFSISVNALIIAQGLMSPVQVVESNSMAPNINTNDGLILGSADPGSLQVGQVVVFNDPTTHSQRIVHRIVGIEQEGGATFLATKGDNNPVADPLLVPESYVQGQVIMRVPGFGIFLNFVHSPYGFLLTVVSPILLILFYSLVRARQSKLMASNRRSLIFTVELLGTR